jgi:general secretion pathway protein G
MHNTIDRLRRRQSIMKDREGGFTLIELLIVIVILAILAAIVVFAVSNLSKQSASASCKSDFQTTETAVEAYKAQMGGYPNATTANGGVAANGPATDSDLSTVNAAANGGELMQNGATAPNTGTDSTVGSWLKTAPANTGHYTISVANTGTGQITVYKADGVTPAGATHTAADCGAVS